jgi:hypothetical protein
VAHPQIACFSRLEKNDQMPKRIIAGQATKLSRTMHDIRYDEVHDEFFVTNPFAQAILVFAGDANGDSAPKRIIQGPKTQMAGSDRLDIDTVHNEIFVPNGNAILVYPLDADGDVAPLRVIRGPDTQLRQATSVVVDPINNVLVIGLNSAEAAASTSDEPNGALLIFNRTDDGNVKPRDVIKGPKSGITRITQMVLYPQRKEIIASQPGEIDQMEPKDAFIGVWSEDDKGDVPPRWRIDTKGNTTLKKPRGVVLDPKHKELIFSDMRINAVLTFYFPEIC